MSTFYYEDPFELKSAIFQSKFPLLEKLSVSMLKFPKDDVSVQGFLKQTTYETLSTRFQFVLEKRETSKQCHFERPRSRMETILAAIKW